MTTINMGKTYGGQIIDSSKVEYVLTVPATWSDPVKALLVKAAEGAGFGTHRENFNLISEPECAAVYTLNAMQPNNFKARTGDNFIVCNAGTWTVDTNSYKIVNMEPLQLDEIVSGASALCGSIFLDQTFERYIRGVLGDTAIDNMKARSKSRMMRTWVKEIKFIFGNVGDEYIYEVAVPGISDNEKANVEDGYHTIQSNVVQEIFDPIVDKIIDLVEQQVVAVRLIGAPVAAILLVGELSSSEYLRKRLQNTQFGWRSTTLQVLQPHDS
ncbi:hypothetical protein BDD12DRAFT_876723 [Trichophaea hybrida]|nr:hypothetical protein BDD12DRAFT_876723 [Trichophaea hybrida]